MLLLIAAAAAGGYWVYKKYFATVKDQFGNVFSLGDPYTDGSGNFQILMNGKNTGGGGQKLWTKNGRVYTMADRGRTYVWLGQAPWSEIKS